MKHDKASVKLARPVHINRLWDKNMLQTVNLAVPVHSRLSRDSRSARHAQ